MKLPLNVMIVDDSKADSNLLERHLEGLRLWDVDYTTCETGDEISAKINDNDPDAIFIDYTLGAETGTEVIRRLNTLAAAPPSS